MDFNFLREVVDAMQSFEKSNPNKCNLNDFRVWLNEQHYISESPKALYEKYDIEGISLENEICKLLLMIGRYAKITLRKGMEDFPELSNEDFTYLYRLMDYEFLTKIQLIEKNGHEKQTGLEIIKRLVRNGLFEETIDPTDKRSKRIAVSKKGKKVFLASTANVNNVSKLLSGNLSNREKETLHKLLYKLVQFHETMYLQHHNTTIDEMLEILDDE
ncbi:MAG: helix-turn-helix domain-containing protein [Weeksellaceae bacterium]|nr:helix-turn-helix domain-containing protein [Weeksellaceae bacterium]